MNIFSSYFADFGHRTKGKICRAAQRVSHNDVISKMVSNRIKPAIEIRFFHQILNKHYK